MVQALQAEIVFSTATSPAPVATLDQIEWLVALLKAGRTPKNNGWITAAQLVALSGGLKDDREIRAIARAATPGIFSYPGSPGYKLWQECTMAEISRGLSAMEAQVRDMTIRTSLYQQAYHKLYGGLS